ncbi:PAS domain-containing protein [Lewinella sp. 4G2]|uniref:sensor histidine kinase n=1 Tax=Lewinella sp. 4G2 TaxID=1803372 RepID=UPI0007B4BEDF|nr:PAS domain-containing protein [Lewinella sp. 4G2]OAV44605.1 hypothetical protein A3850_008920 [Lewinella sp. 4G2]
MNYLKKELYELIKTDDAIFDFLQNSSLDGLWYWDLENREQEWMNARFWETLGYDPAEMPHLASAWQGIINQEDLAGAIERVGQHLADPSVPYDQVVRYRHKDGHTVFIRCRGMAIRDENGQPTRLLGAHIDITQEKEKEILLARSQEAARIGTWSVDLVSNTIMWDDMTKAIHQVEPDYVPQLDEALSFYKDGTSRETITALFQRAVEKGESYDTELELVTRNGNEIWVRAMGHAEMANGECVRVYGIFQDINLRRRNEERVLNYSILEAKSKEMEQFAYIASHDLREPLLTIQGYLEVIQEDHIGEVSDQVKEYMETISNAATRMDQLIKGLLDYSRLSKIKQLQLVDLKKTVDAVMEDLQSITKGINVKVTYTDLPEVMGYPLELKVLLQNLIGNAIKYRQSAEDVQIEITCSDLAKGWEIKVADNGIGIAEKNLQQIFKLFRQLHNTGTYTGSGIGLANCQKIAELHGGRIWATSKLGVGSQFHFTILTRAETETA